MYSSANRTGPHGPSSATRSSKAASQDITRRDRNLESEGSSSGMSGARGRDLASGGSKGLCDWDSDSAPARTLQPPRASPRLRVAECCAEGAVATAGLAGAFFRAAPALREDVRQTFERLGRLLKAGRDLIGVDPRGGIEALGKRQQRLLPRRIRHALGNPIADHGIPAREKRDLLVGGRAFDGGWNRRPGGGCCGCACGASAGASAGGRLRGRRGSVDVSTTCWL